MLLYSNNSLTVKSAPRVGNVSETFVKCFPYCADLVGLVLANANLP